MEPTTTGAAAPATSMSGREFEVRRHASFGPGAAAVGNGGSLGSSRDRDRRGFRKVDSFVTESNHLSTMGGYRKTDKLPLNVTLRLAFQTLGVVWGDLGTSPLYVYDSTFSTGAAPGKDDVLGALSLIVYSLALVPLIKYIFIVLKANDRGNGGTFALYSLICRTAGIKVATNQIPEDHELSSYSLLMGKNPKNLDRAEGMKEKLRKSKFLQQLLLVVALLGTCAVIGDGVLTPAISVLSAMSGIRTNFPNSVSQDVVTYTSAGILILLFCLQRWGTDRVAFLFSPFVLVWFICIFLIGAYNIHFYPAVFKAFNPYYIYVFFRDGKKRAWISLGGVVLAMTGTEAMFADLGHFSVAALQIAFSSLVFPALIVVYTGQAAYLIHDPSVIGATFYKSIPHPVFWPMFVISTCAAIIASQAMITATFSIVEQSMALGCFPKCKLVHTSKKFEGQIYIPEINWILMILTVAITLGFKTTLQIGNAYGVAVVSVMLVTTSFLTLIILMVWQKSLWVAAAFWAVFMTFEGVYYSAVLYKVPQGGWVPLAFVGVFFTIMYIWNYGRRNRYKYELEHKVSMDRVLGLGSNLGMVRVPGVGLVYSELAQGVPSIFAHLTANLPAMHSILVFVCVKHLPVPYVQEEERLLVRRVGPRQYHMYRIAARYGYAERKDANVDFERHIMDSLASYIRTEDSHLRAAPNGVSDSAITVDPVEAAVEQTNESSIDFSSDLTAKISPAAIHNNSAAEVEEEITLLEQSRQAGVLYLVGHTEVRAAENSSFLKRFIIDHAYDFLRRNTRGSTVGLNIPPTKLVQIGMLHYV